MIRRPAVWGAGLLLAAGLVYLAYQAGFALGRGAART
ncbi:hypothetical protein MTsN3n11_04120 [Qipengyuania sp. MTN3-11]